MQFISVKEAMKQGSGSVSVRGWVYRVRGSNKMIFIVLRDSSDIIKCVINREKVSAEKWADAEKLLIESSIEIKGNIKEDKRAPTGYEIDVYEFNVVHFAEAFPVAKDQSTEFLLDVRHLWLRSRKMTAIIKIRITVIGEIHKFFRERGYHEFTPPIFSPTACEGGSSLFEVKYFDDKVYLTQSWQLYAEAAIFALEKIYDVSPTFRAEKSKTSRHLTEFWMAEMEAAWMELNEVTEVAKQEVAFIVQEVLRNNLEDLKIIGVDIEHLKKQVLPFPTITYDEALHILKEKEGLDVEWGKDLRTIEEDMLMNSFETPVVITNYPKDAMAFYKPADPKKPNTTLNFDMIAPRGYGEIIGEIG